MEETILSTKEKSKDKPKVLKFILAHMMPTIALIAAAVTCFFVAPDKEYGGYFNLSTLSTLFCTLAVVAAFKNIRFFTWLAKKIVVKAGTMRNLVFALTFITYFGSMIMANDMALITFLPLGYVALDSSHRKDKMPIVFVLQNVAANLGGMLTPFGNPQNLYLYSYYRLHNLQFLKIMALPFAVAFVLILGVCLTVKNDKIALMTEPEATPSVWRNIVYAVLFALSVLIVFNVLPWYVCLAVVVVGLAVLDAKCLLNVDYGLLVTFCAFFVFSGNLSRIESVRTLLSDLVAHSPLLVGVASCQVISNVPTALLLSRFTADAANLIVAVNIGGLGTPIASLASLITLNEFKKNEPSKLKNYVITFLIVNFGFLAVLIGSQLLWNALGIVA